MQERLSPGNWGVSPPVWMCLPTCNLSDSHCWDFDGGSSQKQTDFNSVSSPSALSQERLVEL